MRRTTVIACTIAPPATARSEDVVAKRILSHTGSNGSVIGLALGVPVPGASGCDTATLGFGRR